MKKVNKKLLKKGYKKWNTTDKDGNDNFEDLMKLSEESLKDVWDNKEDDVWNKYLKNEKKCKKAEKGRKKSLK